jgi:hypothetical protein
MGGAYSTHVGDEIDRTRWWAQTRHKRQGISWATVIFSRTLIHGVCSSWRRWKKCGVTEVSVNWSFCPTSGGSYAGETSCMKSVSWNCTKCNAKWHRLGQKGGFSLYGTPLLPIIRIEIGMSLYSTYLHCIVHNDTEGVGNHSSCFMLQQLRRSRFEWLCVCGLQFFKTTAFFYETVVSSLWNSSAAYSVLFVCLYNDAFSNCIVHGIVP